MAALLDTNVVLRLASPDVRDAIARLRQAGRRLCVAPQSCVEAYVVATRPVDANGLGLGPPEAARLIDALLGTFEVRPDPPDLFERWRRVIADAEVRGVRAHDARIGAYAEGHGLEEVVTHNVRDFSSFAAVCGLRVVRPVDAGWAPGRGPDAPDPAPRP